MDRKFDFDGKECRIRQCSQRRRRKPCAIRLSPIRVIQVETRRRVSRPYPIAEMSLRFCWRHSNSGPLRRYMQISRSKPSLRSLMRADNGAKTWHKQEGCLHARRVLMTSGQSATVNLLFTSCFWDRFHSGPSAATFGQVAQMPSHFINNTPAVALPYERPRRRSPNHHHAARILR